MSATANATASTQKLSIPQWMGHILGLILGLADIVVMTSADARSGDGFESIVWIPMTALAVALIVSLVLSLARKSLVARRVSAVLLLVVGLSALPGLLIPDADAATRVAASVGILVPIAAAALLFVPQRRTD